MNNKKDLVQQAVSTIEEWIRSGKYKNMDLLPSEGEISNMLAVSRATARDAIRVLEVRGFVERIHGVGVKVNDRSTEVAIDFLADMLERNEVSFGELIEMRRLIEPKAAQLAAVNATEEDIAVLLECVEIMEQEKGITDKYQESDFKFHDTIGKASGNRLLYTIESSYRPLLFKQIHEANLKGASVESSEHFHRKIYECIAERDAKGALDRTLEHLDDTEKNLVNN